jgi:hypothetical protein
LHFEHRINFSVAPHTMQLPHPCGLERETGTGILHALGFARDDGLCDRTVLSYIRNLTSTLAKIQTKPKPAALIRAKRQPFLSSQAQTRGSSHYGGYARLRFALILLFFFC